MSVKFFGFENIFTNVQQLQDFGITCNNLNIIYDYIFNGKLTSFFLCFGLRLQYKKARKPHY